MDDILRQNIIQELGLSDTPEEEVHEVITGVGGLIMEVVITRVTDALDDEAVIAFEKILSSEDVTNKEETLNLFLKKNVPNLEELIATCSMEVIEAYKKLP